MSLQAARIGWGVDGLGNKHYVCDYCELYFGTVDPSTIDHKCDTSKKRYHNRGVIAPTALTEGYRMAKSDLRAVEIETHIRDIEVLRKAARCLRNGVKRLGVLIPSYKPSPMEPWQSGYTTIRVMVPEGSMNVMALAAKRLLKRRVIGL